MKDQEQNLDEGVGDAADLAHAVEERSFENTDNDDDYADLG